MFLSPPPPIFPRFPYTTLFRSGRGTGGVPTGPREGLAGRRGLGEAAGPCHGARRAGGRLAVLRRRAHQLNRDRKSTRLNSSHLVISYAVFCLKKKIRHTYKVHF